MGGRCSCARRPQLSEQVVARALLMLEQRVNSHDVQLSQLQQLAEGTERDRLETEAAQ